MRSLKLGSIFWIVAGFASGVSIAAEPFEGIPFKLYQKHIIVVKGSIGDLRNLDLVIDTGANVSVVDQRIAKKLKLESLTPTLAVSLDQTGQFQQAVLPELQFGTVSLSSVRVLVGDLSFFGTANSMDAIVGFDVLSRTGFHIDYGTKQISFGPSSRCEASVPLEAGFPVAVVQIQVEDQSFRMLVDTGGRDLVLFENRLRGRLNGKMRIESQDALEHAGGRSRVKNAVLRQVHLGQSRLENAKAYLLEVPDHAYPGLDGVLGASSLGAKRIQFDFNSGVLGWER